jgi:hypothetical protein
MTIVILVCIFIATLSNLAEYGIAGWILAGGAGYALYKMYKHMHYNMKLAERKRKQAPCDFTESDISYQIQYFMFDDATGLGDE